MENDEKEFNNWQNLISTNKNLISNNLF